MANEPADVKSPSDVELMAQVAGGSQDAFVELVRRHQNGLANFFARQGGYNDAEDMVQETFVRLFKVRYRYRPRAKFTTFLYVLARHVWVDHLRRVARRDRLEEGLQSEHEVAAGAKPPSTAAAARLDVEAAMQALSAKLREVVVLNVYQGLRYQDIAEVLDIPLGTVKSRLNFALHELRKVLDEKAR